MHFENSVEWVTTLLNLTEQQWRTTIAEEKWTIAEVIGHFPAWDQFVLEERLPYLFNHKGLSKAPDENELNHQSSKESKVKTKEEIISHFIAFRKKLIKAINLIEVDLWDTELIIGQTTLTLTGYLQGLVEHDEHHFKQIEELLNRSGSFDKL